VALIFSSARGRHEYVGGRAYEVDGARAGTSARHNRIAGNIFGRLNNHLDGAECEPFISDIFDERAEA
jgi:hypothetical protein